MPSTWSSNIVAIALRFTFWVAVSSPSSWSILCQHRELLDLLDPREPPFTSSRDGLDQRAYLFLLTEVAIRGVGQLARLRPVAHSVELDPINAVRYGSARVAITMASLM